MLIALLLPTVVVPAASLLGILALAIARSSSKAPHAPHTDCAMCSNQQLLREQSNFGVVALQKTPVPPYSSPHLTSPVIEIALLRSQRSTVTVPLL